MRKHIPGFFILSKIASKTTLTIGVLLLCAGALGAQQASSQEFSDGRTAATSQMKLDEFVAAKPLASLTPAPVAAPAAVPAQAPAAPTPATAQPPAPPATPNLVGSIGYARAGGNCINEPGVNRMNGNPSSWFAISATPWIGATALFNYNHVGIVTGIWSNGDLEIRHQNYWGGQHRFPRGAFRGFR